MSAHDRSCLVHSLFDEIFSCLSNLIDAAQSQLLVSGAHCPVPSSSLLTLCDPHDDSPEDDLCLYRISRFSLLSCIKLCRCTIKSINSSRSRIHRNHRSVQYTEEIKLLECLCCTDKTDIPVALKYLDRGGLIITFPRKELLFF